MSKGLYTSQMPDSTARGNGSMNSQTSESQTPVESFDRSTLRVGQAVIVERYGEFYVGMITRVGDKTVSTKDTNGNVDKQIEKRHVYPVTDDNLSRVAEMKDIRNEIGHFVTPLENRVWLLKQQIRGVGSK